MPQFWNSGICNCMMAGTGNQRSSSPIEDPLLRNSVSPSPLEAGVERQSKKRDLWGIAKQKVLGLVRDTKKLSIGGTTPFTSPPGTPASASFGADSSTSSAGPLTRAASAGSSSSNNNNKAVGSSTTAAKIWAKWTGKDKDEDDEPKPARRSKKPKQKDPLLQWFVDHSGGTMRDPPPPSY